MQSLQSLQSEFTGFTKWDYKVSLRVNNDVGGPPKVREYVNRIQTESMKSMGMNMKRIRVDGY